MDLDVSNNKIYQMPCIYKTSEYIFRIISATTLCWVLYESIKPNLAHDHTVYYIELLLAVDITVKSSECDAVHEKEWGWCCA